jgi:hypothetical protein
LNYFDDARDTNNLEMYRKIFHYSSRKQKFLNVWNVYCLSNFKVYCVSSSSSSEMRNKNNIKGWRKKNLLQKYEAIKFWH